MSALSPVEAAASMWRAVSDWYRREAEEERGRRAVSQRRAVMEFTGIYNRALAAEHRAVMAHGPFSPDHRIAISYTSGVTEAMAIASRELGFPMAAVLDAVRQNAEREQEYAAQLDAHGTGQGRRRGPDRGDAGTGADGARDG